MASASGPAIVWVCSVSDRSWLAEFDPKHGRCDGHDGLDVAGNPLPRRERRLLALPQADWLKARAQACGGPAVNDGSGPAAATIVSSRSFRSMDCRAIGLAALQPGTILQDMLSSTWGREANLLHSCAHRAACQAMRQSLCLRTTEQLHEAIRSISMKPPSRHTFRCLSPCVRSWMPCWFLQESACKNGALNRVGQDRSSVACYLM